MRLCWTIAQTTVPSRFTCHPQPIPAMKGTSMMAATAGRGVPMKSGPMCHNEKKRE